MISDNAVKPGSLSDKAELTAQPFNLPHSIGQNRIRLVDLFNRYLIYWVVPVAILVMWQLASQLGWITTRILPAPFSVILAAVKLIQSGEFFSDVAISTGRAVSGLIVGGLIGFMLGLSNGLSTFSEKLFDSTVQMVRTIPNLSLLPLVILWFGIGDSAKLFLVSLGVFFPIYLNTFHGIRSVDPGLIEMGKVYGLSTRELFWQVILPGAMPSILVGVRLSLGIMWLTLIVAETIAADSGIGYLATEAREFVRTDVLLFVVVLYAILGKLSDAITRGLEARLLRWQPRYQTGRKSS